MPTNRSWSRPAPWSPSKVPPSSGKDSGSALMRRSVLLEFRRLLGAAGGVAGAVGMGPGSGELAAVDDQVFLADRPLLEPAFDNLAGAGGVARLRRQRRAGAMRRHA